MTNQEFFDSYKGRKVRASDVYVVGNTHMKEWIGLISSISEGQTITTTTIPELQSRFNKNHIWGNPIRNLVLIEEEVIIEIPENHHPCPKCKSVDCKGLDRIECLLKIV